MASYIENIMYKKKGVNLSNFPPRNGRSGTDEQHQQFNNRYNIPSAMAEETQPILAQHYGIGHKKEPSYPNQTISPSLDCYGADLVHGVKHYNFTPPIHEYNNMTHHTSSRDRTSTKNRVLTSSMRPMSTEMSHNDQTYPPNQVRNNLPEKSGAHPHPLMASGRYKSRQPNGHQKSGSRGSNGSNSFQDVSSHQTMTSHSTSSSTQAHHNRSTTQHDKYFSYDQHTSNHMYEQRNAYEDPGKYVSNQTFNSDPTRIHRNSHQEYYIQNNENIDFSNFDADSSIACNNSLGKSNFQIRSQSPTPSIMTSIEIVKNRRVKTNSKKKNTSQGYQQPNDNNARDNHDYIRKDNSKEGIRRKDSSRSNESKGSSKNPSRPPNRGEEQHQRQPKPSADIEKKHHMQASKTESISNSTYWASIAVAVAAAVISSGGSEESAEIAQVSILNSSKESYDSPEESLKQAATKASLAVLNNGEGHKVAASVTLTCLKKGGISSDATVLGDKNSQKSAMCNITSPFGMFKESISEGLSEGSKALSLQFANFNFFSKSPTPTQTATSESANQDSSQSNVHSTKQDISHCNPNVQLEEQSKHLSENEKQFKRVSQQSCAQRNIPLNHQNYNIRR